jgi:hypothetical protein
MPVSDKIQQLEAQIRQRIERSFGEMRQEILDRFRTENERLRQQLEALSSSLPEGLFRESDLQPVLDEVSEEAKQREAERSREKAGSAAQLTEALVDLDRARSQSELLQALLSQSGRIASRVAVFLAQAGRLKGWGGHGLGDGEAALKEMEIEVPEDSVWARLLAGHGVVRLSSTERGDLSSRLEVPLPREAVLVPLVLRDRVAAAVYADQVGGDGPLPVESLQALTYCTALAIETLPLRKRESTATLQVEEPEVLAEPPEEAPAAEPVTAPPPVEAAPAAPPPAEAPPVPSEAPPVPAPPVVEPAAPPLSAAPEPEVAEEELEVPPEALEEVDMGVDLGEVGEMDLGEVDLEVEEEISLEDFSAEPETPAEPAAPQPPPPAPSPVVDLASGVIEDTRPGTEPEPSPIQPLAAGAGGGAEVAPPSDVQGPGWAFSSGEEMDGDEEARHEEARRLARLLVSEIKLYNEEQVMEGRRSNDIFERLKEDIERSRQLYDARVDERVREKTDYFYQEMVRVLGAGDPKALGI